MFCRNCGKENPENTMFCNHCGAAQDNNPTQNKQLTQAAYTSPTVNSQFVHTSPKQEKQKSKKALGIVIAILVFIVAFVIGYFATGADKVKEPTPFDTPSSFEFDTIPSPSIKYNGDSTAKASNSKTFRIESVAGVSWVTFYYEDDGIVRSIEGGININDTSATGIDDLKNDAKTANRVLDELGLNNSSYVRVTEGSGTYKQDFSFSMLERNSDAAGLAAAFIGFEAENGKIMIGSAEKAMLGFGYTLQ